MIPIYITICAVYTLFWLNLIEIVWTMQQFRFHMNELIGYVVHSSSSYSFWCCWILKCQFEINSFFRRPCTPGKLRTRNVRLFYATHCKTMKIKNLTKFSDLKTHRFAYNVWFKWAAHIISVSCVNKYYKQMEPMFGLQSVSNTQLRWSSRFGNRIGKAGNRSGQPSLSGNVSCNHHVTVQL